MVVAAIVGHYVGLVLICAVVCVLVVWCTALVHKTLGPVLLGPVLLGSIATGVVKRREYTYFTSYKIVTGGSTTSIFTTKNPVLRHLAWHLMGFKQVW